MLKVYEIYNHKDTVILFYSKFFKNLEYLSIIFKQNNITPDNTKPKYTFKIKPPAEKFNMLLNINFLSNFRKLEADCLAELPSKHYNVCTHCCYFNYNSQNCEGVYPFRNRFLNASLSKEYFYNRVDHALRVELLNLLNELNSNDTVENEAEGEIDVKFINYQALIRKLEGKYCNVLKLRSSLTLQILWKDVIKAT